MGLFSSKAEPKTMLEAFLAPDRSEVDAAAHDLRIALGSGDKRAIAAAKEAFKAAGGGE